MATHQPLIRATGDITFTNPWENLGDKFRTWFCISKFAELKVKTTKQSKTRATKLWLVLVLHLIGWESGASFLDQSQSKKAKQSQITFESKLKSVLHTYPNLVWNAAEVIWRTGSLRWSWTKRKAISVHILWLYSHLKFLGISYL